MTLPEAEDLCAYWREFPPAHVLLRGLVGYEGAKRAPAPTENTPEELQAFVAMAKGG